MLAFCDTGELIPIAGTGDGSSAQGPVGIDQISIGEAVVPKMPFGVCSNWTWGAQTNPRATTGQMGLAFRSISSISPEPQCTFMECLQASLPEPIFTYVWAYYPYLRRDMLD